MHNLNNLNNNFSHNNHLNQSSNNNQIVFPNAYYSKSNVNNSVNVRKIGEFKLRLMTKKSEIKIGKINDNYNPERTLIEKDPNTKAFKLTEKKTTDEKTKYSGNLMSEQTSKYLIFNTKLNSDAIEIYPAENWFMFKKDINYKTINLDDAEDKMRMKSHIVESLKNKKKETNISTKEKKISKERKTSDDIRENRGRFKKNFDNDDDDDNRYFKKNAGKKSNEEIEEKDDTDLDLKEMPSDLEEDFFGKKKNENVDLFGSNQDNNESSVDNELSSMFEKSKENSDVEDDLSEIERKFNEQNTKSIYFL